MGPCQDVQCHRWYSACTLIDDYTGLHLRQEDQSLVEHSRFSGQEIGPEEFVERLGLGLLQEAGKVLRSVRGG